MRRDDGMRESGQNTVSSEFLPRESEARMNGSVSRNLHDPEEGQKKS